MNCVRPPTCFAVYLRIFENIQEYVYRLFWSNVIYSNIFSDILRYSSMSLATGRPETQRNGLLPASQYILEYSRISKNMYIVYSEVTLYILIYSPIFFDVACNEEAWNSKEGPPTRFAVYLKILKNICDNRRHLLMNSVIYSNIFSDILRCRLQRGGLKLKGRVSYPLRGIS